MINSDIVICYIFITNIYILYQCHMGFVTNFSFFPFNNRYKGEVYTDLPGVHNEMHLSVPI